MAARRRDEEARFDVERRSLSLRLITARTAARYGTDTESRAHVGKSRDPTGPRCVYDHVRGLTLGRLCGQPSRDESDPAISRRCGSFAGREDEAELSRLGRGSAVSGAELLLNASSERDLNCADTWQRHDGE